MRLSLKPKVESGLRKKLHVGKCSRVIRDVSGEIKGRTDGIPEIEREAS